MNQPQRKITKEIRFGAGDDAQFESIMVGLAIESPLIYDLRNFEDEDEHECEELFTAEGRRFIRFGEYGIPREIPANRFPFQNDCAADVKRNIVQPL